MKPNFRTKHKQPHRKNRTSNPRHNNHYYIYGKHAATSALQNPKRKILQILITQNSFDSMQKLVSQHPHNIVDNHELDMILGEKEPHQGIVIKTESTELHSIDALPSDVRNIAILDQITDPHNIGAIMRSAAAFNIDALILPEINAPAQSGLIAKIASGAMESVHILRVNNLNNAIKAIKQNGFWVIGLDGKAHDSLIPNNLAQEKLAIILGSEGKGIRRLIQSNCDLTIKIPMSEKMESLNVSNAAAIIFHQIYNTQN